jgi:hypothetical protein
MVDSQETHAGRRGIFLAGFLPFEPFSVAFEALFSAIVSVRLCLVFFLTFLPGEGAIVVSSIGGGSARFLPFRSVELVVEVVLIVSAIINETDRYRMMEKGRED